MWIFSKEGFFSIVADTTSRGNVLVRARFPGDLEKLLAAVGVEAAGRIKKTPKSDYKYRMSVPKSVVADYLLKAADGIDYPNFKNAVLGDDFGNRSAAYHSVWSAMRAAQEREGLK